MTRMTVCLLITPIFFNIAECGRILGIFPLAMPSYYRIYHPIMNELSSRGHDVVVVTSLRGGNQSNQLYNSIILKGGVAWTKELTAPLDPLKVKSYSLIQAMNVSQLFTVNIQEFLLSSEEFKSLLSSTEKFDIVVVTQFVNNLFKILAAHFNASLIALSTFGGGDVLNFAIGNTSPPSYTKLLYMSEFDHTKFFERINNVALVVSNKIFDFFYTSSVEKQLIEKYFSKNLRPTNVSLALINIHPSVGQAVPYLPNMVDIGGYHIEPPKGLPDSLQHILDNSKHGVIYLSFGSHIPISTMPADKFKALVETVSKLREDVLWKCDMDTIDNLPPNVKLFKWLPQNDLLAHSNVKLFITHAGMLSTIEAVYHGVPVLAIPFFGDQYVNAKFLSDKGYGLVQLFYIMTKEGLNRSVTELLGNPKYRLEIKRGSLFFRDRIDKPMESAMYWIEHVLRIQRDVDLTVGGLNLFWYQYYLVDIMLFLVGTALLLLTLIVICCYVVVLKKLKIEF